MGILYIVGRFFYSCFERIETAFWFWKYFIGPDIKYHEGDPPYGGEALENVFFRVIQNILFDELNGNFYD